MKNKIKILVTGGTGYVGQIFCNKITTEFPEIDFSEIRSVETVTLEDFSNSHNVKFIDLLWLDVQGAELSVLLQNSGFVKRIVRAIHLEISRKELYVF